MQMTLSEANKLVKKYAEDIDNLVKQESKNSSYVCSINENINDVKPEFDFIENRNEIARLQEEMIALKHKINVYNTTLKVEVDNKEYTLDEVLALMPVLKANVNSLKIYAQGRSKERLGATGISGIIEYKYANYDTRDVSILYCNLLKKLGNLQISLDKANNIKLLEF